MFLTNPNNPTGVHDAAAEAIRAVAGGVPPKAPWSSSTRRTSDFSGRRFIPELTAFPNVIVGRTFSKAYGLAGLRIGAVIGDPDALEPLRRAVPVYSINVAAAVAVLAALADRDYVERLPAAGRTSRRRCSMPPATGSGSRYWKSAANFVLVRAGDTREALVAGAAARGIYLRDRSKRTRLRGLHPHHGRHRRTHPPRASR